MVSFLFLSITYRLSDIFNKDPSFVTLKFSICFLSLHFSALQISVVWPPTVCLFIDIMRGNYKTAVILT